MPDLVVSLGKAVLHDDLSAAKKVYDGAYVVTKIFYRFGRPSGNAHQRMKVAMKMLNIQGTD